MQLSVLPLFAAIAAAAECLGNTGCDSDLASQSVHMIQARLQVSNEQNSSWEGVRVVGAGLSRTGTQSLAVALYELGYTPSHGEDFKVEPAKLAAIGMARLGQPEPMLEFLSTQNVSAIFDQPLNEFAEMFQQTFNSKVILSVHPGGADGWIQSILEFVRMWQIGSQYPVLPLWQPVQGCQVPVGPDVSFPDELVSACKAAYESHNAKFISSVPPDHLLIYNVSQAWGPLCSFLGAAVPTRFGQPLPMPQVDATKTAYKKFCMCGLACPDMKVNGHPPAPGDEKLVPQEAHDYCSQALAR